VIEKVLRDLHDAGYEEARVFGQRPNIVDVLVPGFVLPPESCMQATADIVLPLPTTFPSSAPYGFFAMTSITKRQGTWRNVSKAEPYAAADFFSRKCPVWDQTKHDVVTYLGFVNGWLTS